MGNATSVDTRSLRQRAMAAFLATVFGATLGILLIIATGVRGLAGWALLCGPAISAGSLALGFRRVVRVEDGRVERGWGFFVPWRWTKLTPQSAALAMTARWGFALTQRDRRLQIDLTLFEGGRPVGKRILTCHWRRLAEVRRLAERMAATWGAPLHEAATGVGLRHHQGLDVSLRQRVRTGGFPRQHLEPPPSVDLRLDGGDAVFGLGRPHPHHRFRGLLNPVVVEMGAPLMMFVGVMAAFGIVGAEDFDASAFGALLVIELFVVASAGWFYWLARTEGPVTHLRLTPSFLVAERSFLFLRPRVEIPLASIEDVAVVRQGPLSDAIAVTSDDHVLTFGWHLEPRAREFVAAYLAQWVAFSD